MSQTDPILLDFPDEFESERLIIRAPRPGDGPALNEAITESLENLKPWMPWAQQAPSVEESEKTVRQGVARWAKHEDLWLMLIRKVDGRWIGGSGLHRIDWDVPRFEIGYWVRSSEEGQGYITEAVNRITDFAFATLNAARVEIRCDTRNIRSAAVAKRCGYALEATLHHNSRDVNGELRDDYIFALLRAEWEAVR